MAFFIWTQKGFPKDASLDQLEEFFADKGKVQTVSSTLYSSVTILSIIFHSAATGIQSARCILQLLNFHCFKRGQGGLVAKAVEHRNPRIKWFWFEPWLGEETLLSKAAPLQEPSSLGHPRKWFGHLKFLQQLPAHYLLGSKLLDFCPSGLLKIFVKQQLCSPGASLHPRV